MANAADDLPETLDIIFNCAICNETIPEVYKDAALDKGFRDTNNATHQQPVTKMWLTECLHFFCGKHLEGGGIPFHRRGETPQAVCPACKATTGDTSTKKLYGIRGTAKGQYDSQIPDYWFDAPPIEITADGDAMRAMRFQYISLGRFGCQMFVRVRLAEQATQDAIEQAMAEAETRHAMSEQMGELRARIAELEQCEKELKPWKEREPKIKHYLHVFTEMTRENEKLREQLTILGYAVPTRTYSLAPASEHSRDSDGQKDKGGQPFRSNRHAVIDTGLTSTFTQVPPTTQQDDAQSPPSTRTLSGPSETPAQLYTRDNDIGSNHRPKRPLEDPDGSANTQAKKSAQYVRGESRDLMPPPPRPKFQQPTQQNDVQGMPSSITQSLNHFPKPVFRRPRGYDEMSDTRLFQPQEVPQDTTHPEPTSPIFGPGGSPQRPPSRDYNMQEASIDFGIANQPYTQPTARDDRVVSRHFSPAKPSDHTYPQSLKDSAGTTDYYAQSPVRQTFAQNQAVSRSPIRPPLHNLSPQTLNLNQFVHQPTTSPIPPQHQGLNHPTASVWATPRRHPQGTIFPSTPSPNRRPLASSVASPFFRGPAATEHTGRLTLPERGTIPATPELYSRNSAMITRQQTGLHVPSTPRDAASFFHCPDAVYTASDRQKQSYQQSQPLLPRPNLFAAQPARQPQYPRQYAGQFEPATPSQFNRGSLMQQQQKQHQQHQHQQRTHYDYTVLSSSGRRSGVSRFRDESARERGTVGSGLDLGSLLAGGSTARDSRLGVGAGVGLDGAGGRRSVRR